MFRKPIYAFFCVTDDICKKVPSEYEDCNTHSCGNMTAEDESGIVFYGGTFFLY